MKRSCQAWQNWCTFSIMQAEEEEVSAPQSALRDGEASPLPHFCSAAVLVYELWMGSWPATTKVPSNVSLYILSAKDYFCAKQETDQPLCQEQQIPCSLSRLSSLPKWILNIQTKSLHIFTHAPDWTSASFSELSERVGPDVLQQTQSFSKTETFCNGKKYSFEIFRFSASSYFSLFTFLFLSSGVTENVSSIPLYPLHREVSSPPVHFGSTDCVKWLFLM